MATNKILTSGLLVLLMFGFARAGEGGNFGLGIILGEPTGISGKLWTTRNTAIDGGAAWSLSDHTRFHFHMDYLIHNFSPIKVKRGRLPIYYGIGCRIKFLNRHRDDRIGIRIPVGLDYLFAKAPLDLFFEIVPTLDLIPETEFDIAGGAGIRFYF